MQSLQSAGVSGAVSHLREKCQWQALKMHPCLTPISKITLVLLPELRKEVFPPFSQQSQAVTASVCVRFCAF